MNRKVSPITAEAPADVASWQATVHDLFRAAAARWADRTALLHDGQALTYAELETQSDAVGAYLAGCGVGAGSTVVVWMKRGLQWPAALLGVLKAGAAYVPVDVRDPRERLEYVLRDSAAVLVLGSRSSGIPLSGGVPFIAIEDAVIEAAALPPAHRVHPLALAYVLYTSGTTGRPKGVCVTHANLVHTLVAVAERYALEPDDRVLQFATLSFDVAAEELFTALIRGAAVVLQSAEPAPDVGELMSLITRETLTVLNLPASYWHQWVSAIDSYPPPSSRLRLVVVGSEPADSGKLARWQSAAPARIGWLNAYGSTETTITATVYAPPAPASGVMPSTGTVPIGRPLSGVRAYVLDARLSPVPVNASGELYIAGPGVSLGYLGDPARTAQYFLPDPWGSLGDRMFATGDYVRRSADGVLEFLGRTDDQVKLRGFRIELSEIEQIVRLHPAVVNAVVALREDRPGDQRLVAYVTSGPDMAAGDLAGELRGLADTKLPAHMVPANFVVLDDLPVTSSGKIDRRALPIPAARAEIGAAAVPPRTWTEHRLTAIWREILGTPTVSITDDFFDLGGHSLLATEVIIRIRGELLANLPLRALFDHPTVASLADVIQRTLAERGPQTVDPIPVTPRTTRPPLSFAQQRMWFMDQLVPDSSFFNVTEAIRLTGPIDVRALQEALDGVVTRHEILRTSYPSCDGRPYQAVGEAVSVPLTMVAVADEGHARQYLLKQINQHFNLAFGPIIRSGLIRLSETDHVLWISVHHIAYDDWSNGILLGELSTLYGSLTTGRPAELAPMPIQYADFAIWQRGQIAGTTGESQLSYWRERLAGAPQALPLRTDLLRPNRQGHRGASLKFRFDPATAVGMRNLADSEGCTPFMVLLALFGILLHRYGAGEDIPVATPIANRTRHETEALIGLFFNILVIRLDLSGQPGFRELLRRVREVTTGAYDHQDLPFDQLVEALHPARDPSRNPLAQVLFQLHGKRTAGGKLALAGVKAEPFDFPWTTARVDLEWHLREVGATFGGIVAFATDLFTSDTVATMIDDFTVLAAAIVDNPDRSLLAIPLVGAGRGGGNGAVKPSCRSQSSTRDKVRGNEPPEVGLAEQGKPERIVKALCSIWATLLGLGEVGADDDFFDLGGHSLLATRLVARIGEAFGVQIPLSDLFERSTVGELAEVIAEVQTIGNQGEDRDEPACEQDSQ
jgi:amino acid adenylation domain-containing protein